MTNSLQARLGEALAERGWDASRLAKETGVPYSTIKGILDGHQRTSTRAPLFARALGVDALWLAGTGAGNLHKRSDDVKIGGGKASSSSQNAPLDPVIVAEAEKWVRIEERVKGELHPLRRAERLIALIQMIHGDGGVLSQDSTQALIDALKSTGGVNERRNEASSA